MADYRSRPSHGRGVGAANLLLAKPKSCGRRVEADRLLLERVRVALVEETVIDSDSVSSCKPTLGRWPRG